MEAIGRARTYTFAWGVAGLVIVSLALIRLPETFVEQIRRNRPFDISTAGWIYRLIAIVAFAQAVYVGFVLLRPEKVEQARKKDPKLAQMGKREVMLSIARNAVGAALLTLVYGVSAFALTGERAGYWLFAMLCAAQLAWYFREVGQITVWMRFQPEFVVEERTDRGVQEAPQHRVHHAPPLARGVSTIEDESD